MKGVAEWEYEWLILMPAARAFREMPQWNSYFKSATPHEKRGSVSQVWMPSVKWFT
jgi:hypothetical protein